MNFLDIPPVPFSDPSLGTSAPHLGTTDSHAATVPGDSGWSRSERRSAVRQGGKNEFGWDIFTESAVDLVHLLAFCVCFLLEEGVRGGGYWTHGEVGKDKRGRGGDWTELGLRDAMVFRGDHNMVEVKDEGRRTVRVSGAARRGHGVGGE